MCCGKKDKSNKGLWLGIILAVVAALVGVVLWLKSRNDEYIEEYYEYFDDDVEYVAIKNFDVEDKVEDSEEVEDKQ